MKLNEYNWIYLLFLVYQVKGFNINVQNPKFINGSSAPGSYFGFTVALAPTHSETWILVGAPKSYNPTMPGVKRPGAVHRCNLLSNGDPECTILNIDNKTNLESVTFGGLSVTFRHGKDDSWLGGSLEVGPSSSSAFATCAPKWYNRYFMNEYYMSGMCYEIPIDFNMENVRKLPAFINARRLTALIDGKAVNNYAYAGLGTSLHFSEGDGNSMDHLVMGSPGLLEWTGGFVDIHGQDVKIMQNEIKTRNFARSYIGFATTSGKYFNDRYTYFAFGAPRDEMIGMVIFFRSDYSNFVVQSPTAILQGIDENGQDLPPNSYFGGTLYSMDVNNDDIDDLLVGAPLYSPLSNGAFNDILDLGMVALYLGTADSKRFHTPTLVLKGVEPRGRFGTAIASLGDINGDKYNDVIVGAPYENDNEGAVYIYNGYSEGLWPIYTQRIQASDLNSGMSGFGISMSSKTDMNFDGINDLVIGSYLSDEIVLLHGQPVIKMKGELIVRDEMNYRTFFIDIDDRDQKIEICFEFSDRFCSHLELSVTITLDVAHEGPSRLRFSENNRRDITKPLFLFSGALLCTPEDKFFVLPNNDYISDIEIEAEYSVKTIECPSYEVTPTISRFNGDSPQDPDLILKKQVHFKKDCPNNICKTDLNLQVNADYVNSDGYFLIGNQHLALNVTITKIGDPSFGSNFHLAYPSFLGYIKMEQTFGDTSVSCSLLDKDSNETDIVLQMPDDESGVMCFFGNPMSNDIGVRFLLHMRVPPIVTIPSMTMTMMVKTMSIELDTSNDINSLTIYMKHHVEAIFSGIASEDRLYLQAEDTVPHSVDHIYELDNRGPSTLQEAFINISYPLYHVSGKSLFFLNATEIKCDDACSSQCLIMNTLSSPTIYHFVNGRLDSVTDEVIGENGKIEREDCSKGVCPFLQCVVREIGPQKSMVIYMKFVMNKELRKYLGADKTMNIISHASVKINETNLISNRTVFDQKLMTTIKTTTIVVQEFPWWIIVVSVLVGLLLIVIIVLILWKLGFFKRKTRDQVREMRKSRVPDNNVNSDNTETTKGRDSYTDSEGGIIDQEETPTGN
ncbi:hypothetical protein ACF0H5_008102 [Mactra antiquata]